jgi:hypothetical protein
MGGGFVVPVLGAARGRHLMSSISEVQFYLEGEQQLTGNVLAASISQGGQPMSRLGFRRMPYPKACCHPALSGKTACLRLSEA